MSRRRSDRDDDIETVESDDITLRTGPLDVHGNVVPEEPQDDDEDDEGEAKF